MSNIVPYEQRSDAPAQPHAAAGRPTPIIPRTMEEVWRFANAIAKSGLAPKGMQTPEAITVAIMHGLEIGLTPLMALNRIAVIGGRPALWGDGALALVRASGLLESIEEKFEGENDDLTAICTVWRRDDPAPVVRTFSVEDAKAAKLWGKPGPWQEYRKRMLQMRARAFALRDVFPDVLGGLYLAEELQGGREDRQTQTAPAPQAQTAAREPDSIEAPREPDPLQELIEAPTRVLDVDPQRFLADLDLALAAAPTLEQLREVYSATVPDGLSATVEHQAEELFEKHKARITQISAEPAPEPDVTVELAIEAEQAGWDAAKAGLQRKIPRKYAHPTLAQSYKQGYERAVNVAAAESGND